VAASERIQTMMSQSSWIRRMFEAGARLRQEHGADKVCDFSLGNPDLEPPQAFARSLRGLIDRADPGCHGYMPNGGYPEVRQAIASRVSAEQGANLDADHLLMTCGASGALNVALKTLLNPGDVVLTATPCFMEYRFYVENHGGTLDLVPSTVDFDLDVEALEARITRRTAAVILNSPNNPTGRVYGEVTLRALADMLEDASRRVGRPIYLLVDEPYRRIVYDGVRVPGVPGIYRNTLVGSSYSKDLSVPGERIGWLAIHPGADDADQIFDGFVLCNRILGYVNAPALMQRAVKEASHETVDVSVYRRRRDRLHRELSRMGYEVTLPQGTFYLFPRAPGGDDLAAVDALREELVLTVPGRGFGTPGYFRIAFCVDDAVIERALPGFERALKTLAASR
jgi:aspartate aminotransferase